MSKTNKFVFIALQIVAWVIFVGLCIEAGALLVNFIISLFKPDIIKNLYQKLDLTDLYNKNIYAYLGAYSFILVISFLKAYLFYVIIKLITKFDLENPFNEFTSNQIKKISRITFEIGILSYIATHVTKSLHHHDYNINRLNEFWVDSSAFILMAGIVYIISVIFARGIELQKENDLTI